MAGWHVCVSLWETQKLIWVMSGVGERESSSWWGMEPAPSRRLDSQRLRRTPTGKETAWSSLLGPVVGLGVGVKVNQPGAQNKPNNVF